MLDTDEDVGEATDYSQLPLLRMYENRRATPRVDTRFPVILTTADHQVLQAQVRNISADGLQLRCNPDTARAVHPKATAIPATGGPKLMLRFELPVRGRKHPFAAVGQLRYMTVSRPGEIAFGVAFTRIKLQAKAMLATYLVDAMRPRREN
jgi:hypothetical protein